MQIFPLVNAELLKAEKRSPYVYPEPRVNPSELSAIPTDTRRNKVVGRCQRQTIFKLFGVPPTEEMRPKTARIFRLGRWMESEVTDFLKRSGMFVASGVRTYVPDLIMSFELDIVAIHRETRQAIILENKTVKDDYMMKQVAEGHPKAENLLQLCVYLDYIRTGKRLKELIHAGWKDREIAEEFGDSTMNRIEVNWEVLDQISDGPLLGKLLYEDRANCEDAEADVSLHRDPRSGLTFPCVNGTPVYDFSLDSMYERRKQIQAFWMNIVNEARQVLAGMGIQEPQPPATAFGTNFRDPAYVQAKKLYFNKIGEYFRQLPPSRWPARDYEYEYDPDKLAFLHGEKLLRRTEVTAMNKGERIGDFNCGYCDWQRHCVAAEYPKYRHLLAQIQPYQQPPVAPEPPRQVSPF